MKVWIQCWSFLPDLASFELNSFQLNSAMARLFERFPPALRSLIKFQYGVFGDGETNPVMNMKRFFALQSALADKEVVCKVDKLARNVANDGNKVMQKNVLLYVMTKVLGIPILFQP